MHEKRFEQLKMICVEQSLHAGYQLFLSQVSNFLVVVLKLRTQIWDPSKSFEKKLLVVVLKLRTQIWDPSKSFENQTSGGSVETKESNLRP